jgi:hypothetical protein
MVRARVPDEQAAPSSRPLPRGVDAEPWASLTPDGVLGLQRSIGNHAVTQLLQRVPTARVTGFPMSVVRVGGGTPIERATNFSALRARHRDDAHAILDDLEFDHLWGRLRSDVTGTGDDHDVRIDRQNPTQTGSNVQIQTNGTSVTIATVLVRDSVQRGATTAAVLNAVKTAFRGSLADGMQWEVTDVAAEEKVDVYVKGGGKKGGGGQGGARVVAVQ